MTQPLHTHDMNLVLQLCSRYAADYRAKPDPRIIEDVKAQLAELPDVLQPFARQALERQAETGSSSEDRANASQLLALLSDA